MKIRSRLLLCTIITITLILIMMLLVYISYSIIYTKSNRQITAHELHTYISDLNILTYEYLLHHEKRIEEQWTLKYIKIKKHIKSVIENAEEQDKPSLRTIDKDYTIYGNLFTTLAQSYNQNTPKQDLKTSKRLEERLIARLLITAQYMLTNVSRYEKKTHSDSYKIQNFVKKTLLTVMLFISIAISSTLLFLVRSISLPLKKLTLSSKIIGSGDLDHQVDANKKDELGDLGKAFNAMTNNLKMITTSRDILDEEINERKKAENKLRHAMEDANKARIEAEQANRTKSEFLANISHEIRTPLNAVLGFSELLAKSIKDKRQLSYIKAITSSGCNLLTLINDILDLSKIEAGMLEITLIPTDSKIILQEIEQMFQLRVKEKGLNFQINIDPNLPPTIVIDEIRLRQVLLNLVGNAVKFTDKGYIAVSMTATPTTKHNRIDLIVSVEDSGIGIPPKDHDYIFKSFTQQNDTISRKTGGTGLGLAITRKLVEMMNGKISLTSNPNKGSTFTITLQNIETLPTEIHAPTPKSDKRQIQFEKATVLVVDDVKSNCNLIAEMLKWMNLETIQAENGQMAISSAKKHRPDLIIMDIRMPIMDGCETMEILKKAPLTATIPVIALSASITPDKKATLIAKGFAGFIAKPITFPPLYDELSKHFSPKKSSQAGTQNVPSPEDISPGQIIQEVSNNPELKDKLTNLLAPVTDTLEGGMIIGDMKKLGLELEQQGKQHQCKTLALLGNQLYESSCNFDITKANIYLKVLKNITQNSADSKKNNRQG